MAATKRLFYLDLVNICGNTCIHSGPSSIPSEFDSEELVPLHLSPAPNSPHRRGKQIWAGLSSHGKISFDASINTHAKRTAVMRELCERWRDRWHFANMIGPKKWRVEMFPTRGDTLNFAFEWSTRRGLGREDLAPLDSDTREYEVDWSGRRGIHWRDAHLLVKECMEEASLKEDLVRAHTRSAGCVSYFYLRRTAALFIGSALTASHAEPRTDGFSQKQSSIGEVEAEYIYGMIIPAAFEPKPTDGEVESFNLLDKKEIEEAMRAGRFKPNKCAIVIIDLFVRLSCITLIMSPDFLKIITALHTQFDYERWSPERKATLTQPRRKSLRMRTIWDILDCVGQMKTLSLYFRR
ncbi:hypothetical protein DFH09DRAFT_1301073 [Mycena vulgaris]|nr:hypothetical protein DFH09DRAFT_1301073 [Mycena vulgaris]